MKNRDKKIDRTVHFLKPYANTTPSPTYAAQLILKSNTNI